MDAPPARGTIVRTTPRPEAGITEWTLSNGATVVLKPTKLKEDQILLRATAPGGTSLASDADFIPARVADDVVTAGGVGPLQRRRCWTACSRARRSASGRSSARSATASPAAARRRISKRCSSSSTCASRSRARTPPAFAALASQARGLLANQLASPDVVFDQAIDSALSGNNPRRQPETPATVDEVGSREVDGLLQGALRRREQLHLRLRRQLHAREHQAARRDLHCEPAGDARQGDLAGSRHRAAHGVVERTVQKGIAPKSQVAIVFSGPFPYDRAAPAGVSRDDADARSRGCSTPSGRSSAAPTASRSRPTRARRRGRNTPCGSTGPAIRRRRRRSCSGCSTRSSS